MASLEAPSAWRPSTAGVPVPVPMPAPASSRANPAPPAYGGALQPPPYQNPTLPLGQPPFAAPRLPMAPPGAIQPPLAPHRVVPPPPLLINLDPTSPNPSAMSSNSSQRGAGPADLISFKRGSRVSPLDWTSQFATPVFPVVAPPPQPANGVIVTQIGGGLIGLQPMHPQPQMTVPPAQLDPRLPPPPQLLPPTSLPLPLPLQSQQAVLPPTPRALSPAHSVAASQPRSGSKPAASVAPVRAVERLLRQGDVAGAVRLGWAGTEEELEMASGRCASMWPRAVFVGTWLGAKQGANRERLLANLGRLGPEASGLGPLWLSRGTAHWLSPQWQRLVIPPGLRQGHSGLCLPPAPTTTQAHPTLARCA